MPNDYQAVRVRITGRVQGVYFRVWTRDEASRLGLTGWVRNDADGAVSALIAGPESAVAAMLERFWQGPAGAAVSGVETEPAAQTERPAGFRITR
jgi:acylphosphatase